MPRPKTAEATDNVSALQRGFEVLDCIAAAQRPMTNADVSTLTGIPRPTVSRLLGTLVSLGHLRQPPGSDRYELASGLVRLAEAFLGNIDVRAWARPHLATLAEGTGVSALLGLREGNEMLVVEAVRSRSAVAVFRADVGTRMVIATSALGRAWLSGTDAVTRDTLMAGWRAGTAKTNKDRLPDQAFAALAAEMRDVPERGYALSLGDWHPDINAVAVPVRTPNGEVVAINCGGPAFVLGAQRLNDVVLPQLLAAAQAIAKDIGGVAGRELTLQSARSPVPASTRTPPPSLIQAPVKKRLTSRSGDSA
jgi:DNA-binding IclR family transcriptional regulator